MASPPGSTELTTDLAAQTALVLYAPLGMGQEDSARYRACHTAKAEVIFHDPPVMSRAEERELAILNLPMFYNPHVNGLEDLPNLQPAVDAVIAGR